ncbi:hypothetical protein F4679DRAFT_562105 [Xylaria curta]|nr:hypothetical protein F4679DRAFT_562105 [Xylaria curta]
MSFPRTNSLGSDGDSRMPEHPGSTTEASSPNSAVFPFFSRLPTELRLQIFEVFALPKIPLFFRIWYPIHPSYAFTQDNSFPKKEFWSLRQVSQEARRAVLQGRQAVYDWEVGPADATAMFVDWNRDLVEVFYREWDCINYSPTWCAKVQHVACYMDIQPTKISYFGRIPIPDLVARMPSLRCVNLMLGRVEIPSEFSGGYLRLNDGGVYIDDHRKVMTTIKCHTETRNGYWWNIPISVDAIISRYQEGFHEPGFDEWLGNLVQRLRRFEGDTEKSIWQKHGRIIKCKAIGDPRIWG